MKKSELKNLIKEVLLKEDLKKEVMDLYNSGYSQSEIADELDLNINTVMLYTKYTGHLAGKEETDEDERIGDDPSSKQYYDRTIKEGTGSYKDKVNAFLNHPWQEDLEIDFIDKISEYKDQISKASDEKVKNYLKRFSDQLTGSMMARLTDKFMEDLDELIND